MNGIRYANIGVAVGTGVGVAVGVAVGAGVGVAVGPVVGVAVWTGVGVAVGRVRNEWHAALHKKEWRRERFHPV